MKFAAMGIVTNRDIPLIASTCAVRFLTRIKLLLLVQKSNLAVVHGFKLKDFALYSYEGSLLYYFTCRTNI
jgi:hypothetical protein